MKKLKLFLLTVLEILLVLALVACDNDKTEEPAGTQVDTKVETNTDKNPNDSTQETEMVTESEKTTASEAIIQTEAETETQTEPHVHAFNEWKTTKNATCTAKGEQERTCACGEKEIQSVDMLDHTEAIDNAVTPTCTEIGLTEGKHCPVCGEVLVAQKVIQPLGHNFSEWTTTKKATCTEDGEKQRICSCGEKEIQSIDMLGHSEAIDKAITPTCTETGLTEGKHCSVCGKVLVAQKVVQPLGHNFSEWTTIKEATCTEDGEKQRVCACGEKETHSVEALGHVELVGKSIVIDPPITGDISVTNTCSVCGAIYDETVTPLEFTITSENRALIGYTGENGKNLIIPTIFQNNSVWYRVTNIGDSAFYNCTGLTSITMPNSIINIGNSAFYECSELTSITISNRATRIGNFTLAYCSKLTSITIPDSVTSIGLNAFYYCSGLTSITIPNSVTGIGYHAFEKCSGLTSVTISNNVTKIGDQTFYGCTNLTSITIPDKVTEIGVSAFKGCSSLTSVNISNSVTTIYYDAFRNCSKLTSINFDGTKAQWNAINKGSAINYTIHCIDGDISK